MPDTALPSESAAAHSGRPPSRYDSLPSRAPLGDARGEPFAAPAAKAPSPTSPAPAPAPAPEAPPNPYKVAGTLVQDGGKRLFLLKGERIFEARPGDALEGNYRVEAVAADHVVLLYLPLDKREKLPIAATLGADVPLASSMPAEQAAVAAPGKPAAAGEEGKLVQLRWEGPARVRSGAPFALVLRASSALPLRASPMQIRFEPKVLEAVDVKAGKFFGGGSFSYRVNPDGAIFVGASGSGGTPGDEAELLVLTFRPIKAGATAEVQLSSLALQGAAGRALPHRPVSPFRTAIQ